MIALAASVPVEHPPFFSISLYFFKMATNCIDPDNLHQTPVFCKEKSLPPPEEFKKCGKGNLWIVVKDVKTLVVYDVE